MDKLGEEGFWLAKKGGVLRKPGPKEDTIRGMGIEINPSAICPADGGGEIRKGKRRGGFP